MCHPAPTAGPEAHAHKDQEVVKAEDRVQETCREMIPPALLEHEEGQQG
ncbi:hypothetical protein Rumeso_02042 [Rubellimicrobium mesophilum DSM 19309]|uniref:Uncharacterized protein n=1 Tax=Rubellimicrobium mesophilum DSM 19309 TaxID=442562 RepID=A0A017HQC0_9RHOB|nr:hypothetical protein Rumeso_02042 [Rubellimicrobium mesophilum DSM 19309]